MAAAQTYAMGHGREATSSHASRTPESDAGFLLQHLRPDDHILDVGCGPGTVSVTVPLSEASLRYADRIVYQITTGLCSYVPQGFVTGIDIAPKVLSEAAKLANTRVEGRPKNLDFFAVDVLKPGWAEDLPDGNAVEACALPVAWKDKFNAIFESQVFVHLPDPVGALKRLRPCVKEGGLFALRDFDIGCFIFHPDPSGKLKRWNDFQSLLVLAERSPSPNGGRDLYGWTREAGFPAEKIDMTMSSFIYRGPEQRKWWSEVHSGRLAEGKPQRKILIEECGITAVECEEVRQAILKWAEDPEAHFSATAYQIIARV